MKTEETNEGVDNSKPIHRGRGAIPGHPRFGGRKPGSRNRRTQEALEICERLNFHPAEFLAIVAKTGQIPNEDGSMTPATNDERLRAAVALAPFVMPRLAVTQAQISGSNGGPVSVATLDVNKLLASPEAIEAAQQIGLALANQQRTDPLDEGPGPKAMSLVTDSKGHWQ